MGGDCYTSDGKGEPESVNTSQNKPIYSNL